MPVASHRWRLAADLIVTAALVWGGVKLFRSWRQIHTAAVTLRRARAGGVDAPGASLGSVAGVNLAGQVTDFAPGRVRRIVAFLVRPASARSDLNFWWQVATALGGARGLRFEGYCEANACAAAPALPSSVVLLRAGVVRTTDAVVRSDRAGDALLLNAGGDWQVVRNVSWRAGGNPAVVAAAIAKAP